MKSLCSLWPFKRDGLFLVAVPCIRLVVNLNLNALNYANFFSWQIIKKKIFNELDVLRS